MSIIESPENCDENIFAVQIESSDDFISIAETGLQLLGISVTAWYDEDLKTGMIREFFDSEEDAVNRCKAIEPHLAAWSDNDDYFLSVEKIPREDWQNSWKKFFHTQRISERIVIKPSWESFEASETDIVIELDPGMSFGTGLHPTTRACIRFLEDIAPSMTNASFLDLGCGSGILSIAAARLGFTNILAVDYDKSAVEATLSNCSLNNVGVECIEGDLANLTDIGNFDVVAANILSGTLTRFASRISSLSAGVGDSYLLLAGILKDQYPDIRKVYEDLSLKEIVSVDEGEWTSGMFKKE